MSCDVHKFLLPPTCHRTMLAPMDSVSARSPCLSYRVLVLAVLAHLTAGQAKTGKTRVSSSSFIFIFYDCNMLAFKNCTGPSLQFPYSFPFSCTRLLGPIACFSTKEPSRFPRFAESKSLNSRASVTHGRPD